MEDSRYISKYVGIVKLSDPTEVGNKLNSDYQDSYSNGGVFCSCPELGLEGGNLIYCRYGLSIPFYKVKDGDRLWIQPTVGLTQRWIYTGFVDCGRASVAPTSDTQVILENEDGTFEIKLGSTITLTLDSNNDTVSIDCGGSCKIDLDASSGVVITTPIGASAWKPNTLPNCLFTGAPHSTITDLQGA